MHRRGPAPSTDDRGARCPARPARHAVIRAPCSSGRVSSATTSATRPVACSDRTTPSAVPHSTQASAPALQCVVQAQRRRAAQLGEQRGAAVADRVAGRDVLVAHGQRGGQHGGRAAVRHAASARRTPTARLTAVGRAAAHAAAAAAPARCRQRAAASATPNAPATPSAGRAAHREPADGVDQLVDVVDLDRAHGPGSAVWSTSTIRPSTQSIVRGSTLQPKCPTSVVPTGKPSRSQACGAGSRVHSVGRRVARRRLSGRPVSGAVPPVSYVHADGIAPRHRGPGGSTGSRWTPGCARRAPRRSPGGCRCSPTAPTARRQDHLAAARAGAGRRPGGGAAGPHRRCRGGVGGRAAARDGARPAVLAAAPGVVEDHAVWLATPDQIAVLDRCEGRDDRFRLARLRTGRSGDGAARGRRPGYEVRVPGATSATRRSAARCWWTVGRCGVRTCRRRSPSWSASPRRATASTPTP